MPKKKARAQRSGGAGNGIGLALAGGGPLGAIYEIGALAALADSVPGLNLNDLDIYVGVSAGSVVAAGLANGFTPRQMTRLFIEGESTVHPFTPEELLPLATEEFQRRLKQVPPLLWSALLSYLRHPAHPWRALEHLGRALPTGVFSGTGIDQFLRRVFAQPGCTNDFRQLRRKLIVVATELDTGIAVEWGQPDTAHIPISRAVQASTALPGLFAPVQIEGRHFVDGALRKTLHASVALEHGVGLLLCLNPLVPFDASAETDAPRPSAPAFATLVDGGLPVVLSQMLRSLIHSRLDTGMERYKAVYPHTDIMLLQPQRTDADMFLANLFSYSERRALCELAYQRTRAQLLAQRRTLAPLLQRHGLRLDTEALRDTQAKLVRHEVQPRAGLLQLNSATALRQLDHALDDLTLWLRAQRR